MRKNLSFIFLVVSLIAVMTLLLDYKIRPAIVPLEDIAGKAQTKALQAPDFSFTDLNGNKGTLSQFKGKTIILHFWATWCPPCIAEFPKLLDVSREFRDDIVLLAVSSDNSPVDIRKFLKSNKPGANIHLIWDKDRAITQDLYQTFTYPETILIDSSGRMVRKIPGDANWTAESMKSVLRALASGPVIP